MIVGLIGTGAMGFPMARRLIESRYEVILYARRPERIAELGAQGAQIVESPAALGTRCNIVLTILPDGAIVREVLVSARMGEVPGAASMVIDCSTSLPSDSRANAELLQGQGIGFVDAPMSGGPPAAQEGSLTFMVGGSPKEFEEASKVLAVLGDRDHIFHVGPTGSGATLKLINNLLLTTNVAVLAEAFRLARQAGLAENDVVQVVSGSSGTSRVLEKWLPRKVLANDLEPGFSVQNAWKDCSQIAQMAQGLGVAIPFSSLTRKVYEACIDAGWSERDFSVALLLEGGMGSMIGGGAHRVDLAADELAHITDHDRPPLFD